MVSELELGKKRGRAKKVTSSVSSLVSSLVSTSKTEVTIDHPKNGEKFQPHHYAVRIGLTDNEGGRPVEISIDNGEWKPCRLTSGYYWYDWHSIPQGKHKLVAQVKLTSGKYKKSNIVYCEVQ